MASRHRLGLARGAALFSTVAALAACPAPPTPSAAGDAGEKAPQKPLSVSLEPPRRKATKAELEAMLPKLEAWVKPGATNPKNAWALAHGLLAFGPEMKASDGRLAIDVLVKDYLESSKVGGKTVHVYPEKTADGTPVEPHPSMIVKKMLENGVSLDHSFELKPKGKITLDQLVADREWVFEQPNSDEGWRTFAWSFMAFLLARGERGTIVTQNGELKIAELSKTLLNELDREQDFLIGPMRAGRPDAVEKRKQGIYGHTCGGFHFVQAALLAAKRLGDPASLSQAENDLNVLRFRWDAERRIYQQTMAAQPKYRWLLLVQEVKFHGHLLETFALAEKWGLLQSSPELDGFIAEVSADLIDAFRELESVYGNQQESKTTAPQSYYDLIGDGCHAIRGLRMALAAFYRG